MLPNSNICPLMSILGPAMAAIANNPEAETSFIILSDGLNSNVVRMRTGVAISIVLVGVCNCCWAAEVHAVPNADSRFFPLTAVQLLENAFKSAVKADPRVQELQQRCRIAKAKRPHADARHLRHSFDRVSHRASFVAPVPGGTVFSGMT